MNGCNLRVFEHALEWLLHGQPQIDVSLLTVVVVIPAEDSFCSTHVFNATSQTDNQTKSTREGSRATSQLRGPNRQRSFLYCLIDAIQSLCHASYNHNRKPYIKANFCRHVYFLKGYLLNQQTLWLFRHAACPMTAHLCFDQARIAQKGRQFQIAHGEIPTLAKRPRSVDPPLMMFQH